MAHPDFDPDDEGLTERITIRVKPSTLAAVKGLARKDQRKHTDAARVLLLAELGRRYDNDMAQ